MAYAWAIAHCGCDKDGGPCEGDDKKKGEEEKKKKDGQGAKMGEPPEPPRKTYADPDSYPVPRLPEEEPNTSGPDPGDPRWTEPYATFTPDVSAGY